MAKGGRRSKAGRPSGAKDGKPRGKKKISMPIAKGDVDKNLPATTTYLPMEKFLSANNKKLYKSLVARFDSPSDCLIAIRDDLVARYNLGRIGEMEECSNIKKAAKEGLKELEEYQTLDGRKLTPIQTAEAKKRLKSQSRAYPQLSSKVTTLASEIRQINELIDRIDSGRPDKVINLFNILSGKVNPKKVKELEDKIFDIGEFDPEFEDGEIVEEEEESDET